MKVWIVGSAGYDYSSIDYVCLSYESAVKRWNDVRNSLIKKCEEMIEYEKINNYEHGGWAEDIRLLMNLKPGETDECDHPYIEEHEAEL
jgi:hypothetical protein